MCPTIVPDSLSYEHPLPFQHPPLIRKPLELVIDLIQSEFGDEVAMIWLFGSYARGDFINDRRVDQRRCGARVSVPLYSVKSDILLVLNAPLVAARTKQCGRKLKRPQEKTSFRRTAKSQTKTPRRGVGVGLKL